MAVRPDDVLAMRVYSCHASPGACVMGHGPIDLKADPGSLPWWALGMIIIASAAFAGFLLGIFAGCAAKPTSVSYVHGDEVLFTSSAPVPKVGETVHFPAGGAATVTSVQQHDGRWYVYFPGMDGP